MLLLVGVLLSCGALCLASPVPPTAGRGCIPSSLILETLNDIQTLNSMDGSKITLQNNVMEAGGNITTYLQGFIEALKSSKESSKEILIAQKLRKIQDAAKPCLTWLEQDESIKDVLENFSDLEFLLRFLNHYASLEKTA